MGLMTKINYECSTTARCFSVESCAPAGDGSETRMNVRGARWLLVTIFMLVAALTCSPAATESSPTSPLTLASKPQFR
jgi:hypothetical protein